MNPRTLPRRRPVPTAATVGFLLALVVTGAYWAGLFGGAKTLPTFATLLGVTAGAAVLAALAWIGSLVVR